MEKKKIVKEYSNGDITIVWKPDLCIHSTHCWKGEDGLLDVFNPREKPWINPEGATSEQIMNQVEKCPSGALSYYKNGETQEDDVNNNVAVEVVIGGPLICKGPLSITLPDGTVQENPKMTAFCRCGASQNKPFCDGSHKGLDGFQ